MTDPIAVHEHVIASFDGQVPATTIFHAMQAALALEEGRHYDLGMIALGNGTAVRMFVTPLGEDYVGVSAVNLGTYPFKRADGGLHWTYVSEKLVRNVCDAVALTLILGTILRREAWAAGACECERHAGLK